MKKWLFNAFMAVVCTSAIANDTWVVPYAAGGPSDVYSRAITGVLELKGRDTIIVENIPGASGTLGVNMAMQKKKFVIASPSELFIAPQIQGHVNKENGNWQMLALFGKSTLAWVTGVNTPYKSMDDVIKKSKVTMGNVGEGSLYHLVNLEFVNLAGMQNVAHIPYKNSPQLIQDIVTGELDVALVPLASPITDFIKAGKLRALAVTQKDPWPLEPNIPAIGENPKFENVVYTTWIGLFGDKRLVQGQATKWNQDVTLATQSPEIQKQLRNTGTYSVPMNLAETSKFFDAEKNRYQRLVDMYLHK